MIIRFKNFPHFLYIFFAFLSLNIFFFSTDKNYAKSFDIKNVDISRPFEDKTCILSRTSCCFTLYITILFQGAIILKPSPLGGPSVTTPPPSVLNNTPASPDPIFTDDLDINTINNSDIKIIGKPMLGKFFI